MPKKLTIRDTVLLVLLAAATITLTWKAKGLEKRFLGHSDEPAMTNKQAPEFEAQSLSGENITSRNFKGKKKVVVSFWANWCEPCRMELPELKAFYEKYHSADSSFEVMAVSTDQDRYQAEKYVKEAVSVMGIAIVNSMVEPGSWDWKPKLMWLKTVLYYVLPSTNLLSEERFLSLRQAALKPTTWLEHGTSLLYGLDYAVVILLLAMWLFQGRTLRRD